MTKIHSHQNQEKLPMVSIELTKPGQGPMKGILSPNNANQKNMVEFEIRKIGLVVGHMFNYSQVGFHKGTCNFQRSPNDNFGFFSYLHHYNCSGFFMPIIKNDVMF